MGDKIIGGTGNVGHLFECYTSTDTCKDLGQAIPGMDAIGSLVVHEGKVYGGTALWGMAIRLFVYDPITGDRADLGVLMWFDYYANALLMGDDGRLYGATGPDGHLFAYDLNTGQYTDLGMDAPGDEIHTLVAGPDGVFYGGSSGGYLFRYDPVTNTYTDLGQPVPSASSVHALAFGGGVQLYGGTGAPTGTFFVYATDTGTTIDKGRAAWGSNAVYALLRSSTDTIYGGGTQLFAYGPGDPFYGTPGTAVSTEIIPAIRILADAPYTEAINALAEGSEGLIYGGGGDEGHLFAYDPNAREITDLGQAVPGWYDDIACLAAGTDGRIYGGSTGYQYYSGRLFIYDPATGLIIDRGQAVPFESGVHALTTGADGRIYGGTSGSQAQSGQLFVYDPGTDTFTYRGQVVDEDDLVAGLVTAGDGKIYGGTAPHGHLFVYDPETDLIADLWASPDEWNEVSAVTVGGDGKIYGGLGEDGHVFVYDPVAGSITDLGRPVSGGIGIIALAASQNLIYGISTHEASGRLRDMLFALDTGDGTIRVFGQPLPHEWYTNSLATVSSGRVYGGSAFNHGHLFAYDPAYPFEWGIVQYSADTPLDTAVTVDILDVDGALLLDDVESGQSLKSIDRHQVPSIRLRADLSTSAGGITPKIQSWSVAWPTVEVTPRSLFFLMHPEDPDIISDTVQIHCVVGETLSWDATVDQPWLSCSPASGDTPALFTVAADKSGLAQDTWHHGQVTIDWSYEFGGGTELVGVSLYVGVIRHSYFPVVMQHR